MKASELKEFNMDMLRKYIFCENNLIYEYYDTLEAEGIKITDDKDYRKSSNNTIHEYDVLEASLDNDEFNIQLSRITKFTEDRYSYFADMIGAFDKGDETDELIILITKAQLKIVYYCEELIQ